MNVSRWLRRPSRRPINRHEAKPKVDTSAYFPCADCGASAPAAVYPVGCSECYVEQGL